MTEVNKDGSVMLKTNNSAIGNRRSIRNLALSEGRKKPLMVSEEDSEAQGEELHWMASAAYNQSK